jgi:hypothetical protein
MRGWSPLAVPRLALLVACMVTLLGHLCVPIWAAHTGHGSPATGPSALSVAPFEESCEALPSATSVCPAAVAVEGRLMTPGVLPARARAAAAPAPTEILRPPRYLLHAALLN